LASHPKQVTQKVTHQQPGFGAATAAQAGLLFQISLCRNIAKVKRRHPKVAPKAKSFYFAAHEISTLRTDEFANTGDIVRRNALPA